MKLAASMVAGLATALIVLSASGQSVVSSRATGGGLVDPQDMPGPLKDVGFDQNLGKSLPLDTLFFDDQGREVRLGDYFGERPVILTFVYYDCPMLCPMVLNGVAKSLGVLSFDVGQEFDVVAISIDPNETPEMAAGVKQTTVKRYGREETADGWHFLTGSEQAVRQVTDTAGFRYAYLPETGEFAHASGMIVVTPEGTLAQYLYGLDFAPRHVQLALVEASSNQIGSVVDQLLLYCFRYDPKLGKYTVMITRILRLAGVLFILGLALFLWIMRRRDLAAARQTVATLGAVSR